MLYVYFQVKFCYNFSQNGCNIIAEKMGKWVKSIKTFFGSWREENENILKLFRSRFILNLCVDSKLKDDSEPAMIAFHFRTHFVAHDDGKSGVFMSWKKGPHGWEETVEEQNTWIDDDGKFQFFIWEFDYFKEIWTPH